MALHFATIWEAVADRTPERPAVICEGQIRRWGEYENRAARLASALTDAGLGPGSKVGLYMHNSIEYLEAQFAVFKIGGCPINVNYRYKADELVYLLDNSDAEALVFQSSYAMRIWEIRERLPDIKLYLQVDDGSAEVLLDFATAYETVARTQAPMPRRQQEPGGVYMLYTGGTTGMPKGVMYDVAGFCSGLMAIGAGGLGLAPPTSMSEYQQLLDKVDNPPVNLPAAPMMHGTGMWLGCMVPHALGGTVVATSKLGLDADLIWQLAQEHQVTDLVIVGDAFAKPLLGALSEAAEQARPYRPAQLQQIISSGVMWSAEVKQALLEHLDCALVDIMGSSEGGMGMSVMTRELAADAAVPTAQFALNEGVKIFNDLDQEVLPGSDDIGMIATSGMVPLGYYKDDAKSQATFREIDGVRYSFPGDFASVAADGTVTLLGRGSACINTAGEKVFPEEVEEALKKHPQVYDTLVVGLPDERFGQRVVAVVSGVPGAELAPAQLVEFAREHLAGYKVPKQVLSVAQVRRAPNGKADYKWARQVAEDSLQSV
ncbi:MAG: AMP-binding protein [Pseudomonadales bacterium]